MSKIVSLSELVLPKATVDIPGTGLQLSVGALTFENIVSLFMRNKPLIADIYMRFIGDNKNNQKFSLAALGAVINEAPDLAATVIVIGLGEQPTDDNVAKVRGLSITVQTEMLQQIATLTFGRLEDDAVKKFLVTVADAMHALTQVIEEVSRNPSITGSAKSAGT